MIVMLYMLVAVGCERAGWGFWQAALWPAAVGEIIVAAYERHVVERGE